MPSVAIIGASAKPERMSYLAVQRYKDAGWTVWPVHPSGITVADVPCFKDVTDIPGKPDIVSLYVNAGIATGMLPDIAKLEPEYLWLNPGADDPELAQAAEALGLKPVIACNLVALGRGDPLAVAAEILES